MFNPIYISGDVESNRFNKPLLYYQLFLNNQILKENWLDFSVDCD